MKKRKLQLIDAKLFKSFEKEIKNIDKTLIVSETELAWVNESEFTPDSWIVGDKYIEIAIEIITKTICNLYQREYIDVTTIKLKHKILPFLKKNKYLFILLKKPDNELTIGWLEEKILGLLSYEKRTSINYLINKILVSLFDNKSFINPGKAFIIYLLANQNCNFYHYEFQTYPFKTTIKVWRIVDLQEIYHRFEKPDTEIRLSVNEDFAIRKIIKKQLLEFQDWD